MIRIYLCWNNAGCLFDIRLVGCVFIFDANKITFVLRLSVRTIKVLINLLFINYSWGGRFLPQKHLISCLFYIAEFQIFKVLIVIDWRILPPCLIAMFIRQELWSWMIHRATCPRPKIIISTWNCFCRLLRGAQGLQKFWRKIVCTFILVHSCIGFLFLAWILFNINCLQLLNNLFWLIFNISIDKPRGYASFSVAVKCICTFLRRLTLIILLCFYYYSGIHCLPKNLGLPEFLHELSHPRALLHHGFEQLFICLFGCLQQYLVGFFGSHLISFHGPLNQKVLVALSLGRTACLHEGGLLCLLLFKLFLSFLQIGDQLLILLLLSLCYRFPP